MRIRTILFASWVACSVTATAQPPQPGPIVSASFYVPAVQIQYFNLGDIRIPVKVLQYGSRNDILCINLHDNEYTSVEAARTILQSTGGTLVKIENGRQRVIRFLHRGQRYAFDPNRMFSPEGIKQSLRENCGRYNDEVIVEIGKFANFILALIPDSTACIVALHNNTNEAFSVKSYLEGSDREKDAKEVIQQEHQDPDDIILTTDEQLYRKMGELGFNAIWQDNENARRDGSLSIWSGENQRRYINIETQHGRLAQYIEMFRKLMDYLDESPEPVEVSSEIE